MIRRDHLSQDSSVGPSRWRSTLWIAAIALIYFGAARLGLSFTFEPEGIAAIWPPTGIFLSAILLTRRSVRPYLVATLFFTDLIAEMLNGTPVVVSLVYAAALTGDAVLSTWLLQRFVGELLTFRQVRQVVGFVLLCVLLSNAAMSVVAALAAATFLRVPFWSSWLWWWASDGAGSLLVTPLIMGLAFAIKTRFAGYKKSQFIEGTALLFLTAFLSSFLFSRFADHNWLILLFNLFTFPLWIWASFRFGVIGAAMISAILAGTIVRYAIAGSFAQFGIHSNLEAIVLVELYIAMASIPSILLAALITERKQAGEALRESEEIFRCFMEYSPIYVFFKDENIRAIRLSKNYETLLGKPLAELLGKSMDDLFPSELAKSMVADDMRILREGKEITVEEELNGRIYMTTKFPILVEGKPRYLAGFTIDITERRRAEDKLRLSEYNLAEAERIGNTGSWEYDVASDTAAWSENMFRICDVDPAMPKELVFKHFVENRVHPDDRAWIFAVFQDALSGKRPYDLEYRIVRKDGSIRDVHALAETLRDEKGQAIRMIGKAEDITERKKAEAQIKGQLEELQRWHDAIIGREGRVLDVKKEVNELLARLGEPPRYPSALEEQDAAGGNTAEILSAGAK